MFLAATGVDGTGNGMKMSRGNLPPSLQFPPEMTELRTQMESVFKNVRDELRNKDLSFAAKEIESNNGVHEGLNMEKVIFDPPLKFDDVLKEESCLQGMDRLEA
ncbi:hypothetical protein V6N13_025288 [Hibiscus sabdariffa]|uniref:Uncharacterized protein n=1 Tax=Hibiscus sabdariffa TaxID=183260 RepID=A0ABR2NHI1_9ROSI